jgi:hypothetical protein
MQDGEPRARRGRRGERFQAALQSKDGKAACAELSEETASKLEQQEKKPCEQAILGLELPKGGSVAFTEIEVTSAYVRLAEEARTSSTRGRRAGASRRPAASRPRPTSPTNASWRADMRAMFVVYLILIAGGIAYCAELGFMHN